MSTYLTIRSTSLSTETQKAERLAILSALRTLLVECGCEVVDDDHDANYDTLELNVSTVAVAKLHVVELALAPTERPTEPEPEVA